MQCVLNFSGEDRRQLAGFLKKFPKAGSKSGAEELRCKIGESAVTLYKTGKLLVQGKDCEEVKQLILEAVGSNGEVVLGIDEAGRGESFGPFVVAAVLAEAGKMRELRDSKKLKKLEAKMAAVEKNALGIGTAVFSARKLGEMHEKGITLNEIEAGAINSFRDFFKGSCMAARVLVDGSPLKGCRPDVEFIVKGDDLNPVIGAASVVARSTREKSSDREKRAGWGSWRKRK